MNAPVGELLKQHLIDPEICIRCNTCEETCPVDAVTHDGNNYVDDASICNHCMDCISPCPTGSIDNWRVVANPYTLEEQFSWSELPACRSSRLFSNYFHAIKSSRWEESPPHSSRNLM